MGFSLVSRTVALLGVLATSGSFAQTIAKEGVEPLSTDRPSIADYPRNPAGAALPDALPATQGHPLFWDNGPLDNVTAHLSQRTPIGSFLAADDFFIQHDFWACIDHLTVCFAVSDTIDGVMTKPTFGLTIYNDCAGRPDTVAYEVFDPELIQATLVGPSAFAGFNLWTVTFQIHQFVGGYQRPWISAFGVADLQDAQYYWLSANNGVVQGAQAQLKNGAEPWMDAEQCDCPGICTDLYLLIAGRRCCLAKDNTPLDPNAGAKSLQLKGATIDTARAADNFQIGPHGPQALCAVEAWFATNCPLDKVFLEIYENVCNMPGDKLFSIDVADQPTWEDTGLDFQGVNIYRLFWKLDGPVLQPGRDYWLSVVARGTGSILDKGSWMHLAPGACTINITEGKVKDPFVAGLEGFVFVSEATMGPPRDFAFRLWTSPKGPPPVVGACCTSASCIEGLTEAACLSNGGVFFPNQICANNPCATVISGCCLPTGGCQDMLEPDCTGIGGFFLMGQNCITASCEFACCFGGNCVESTVGLCAVAGGDWFPGETCATVMCTAPAGACCSVFGGVCTDTTLAGCDAVPGIFLGAGTSCATDGCVQVFGACCSTFGGVCVDTSAAGCDAVPGTFLGAGTSCATDGCAQVFGACCSTFGGVCVDTSAAGCDAVPGIFLGAGTSCATDGCAQVFGACCSDFGGVCTETTLAGCDAVPGTFLGAGTSCATDPCAPPIRGGGGPSYDVIGSRTDGHEELFPFLVDPALPLPR